MLKFYDKAGQEINQELWEQFIRSPKYVFVERHTFGVSAVETSWVGIQTQYDAYPSLFVTITRKHDTAVMIKWHYLSLLDARKYHFDQAKEIGIPVGGMR